MSAQILTPTAVWGDFEIKEEKITSRTINEKRIKDVVITTLLIEGKKTATESVQILARLAKNVQNEMGSAVILLEGATTPYDEKVVYDLAKSGYLVLDVDLTGKTESKTEYTIYPQELSCADYEIAKQDLLCASEGVKKTCWYEWGVSLRYAVKYLRSIGGVLKVGAIGINESATPLWHLIATDEVIDCAVMIGNAGWGLYKNDFKWSGEVDRQYSEDNDLKVLAGIEPQAYAKNVNCPTLMLSPTNSGEYDVDRAFDTVERIDEKYYSAVDYSVGYDKGVDYESYINLKEFLARNLAVGVKKGRLPKVPEIKAELKEGKFEIEVSIDKVKKEGEGIKQVMVYCAEGTVDPKYRCWVKLDCEERGGKYYCDYSPYHKSKLITLFAKAVYQTGYSVSSSVICKKFSSEQVKEMPKSTVIYSGRRKNSESVFAGITDKVFDIDGIGRVIVKNGPMEIEGTRAEKGLITFKVNAEKDKPKDDAILLVDLFVREDTEVSISLIADYFGEKTEYSASVKLSGGKVWHNVMLERLRFKSAEGRTLKDYSTINAIVFKSEGKYLINNALWV